MFTMKLLYKALVSGLGEPTLFIQQGENTHGLGREGGGRERRRERERERRQRGKGNLASCMPKHSVYIYYVYVL